jgi:hypothetical protein
MFCLPPPLWTSLLFSDLSLHFLLGLLYFSLKGKAWKVLWISCDNSHFVTLHVTNYKYERRSAGWAHTYTLRDTYLNFMAQYSTQHTIRMNELLLSQAVTSALPPNCIVLSNLICSDTTIQHRQQLAGRYFHRNGFDFQLYQPNFEENREIFPREMMSVLYSNAD